MITDMEENNASAGKRLVRPREGRLLAGVCVGLAGYFGVDVNLVRLGFGVFTVFWGLGLPDNYLNDYRQNPRPQKSHEKAEATKTAPPPRSAPEPSRPVLELVAPRLDEILVARLKRSWYRGWKRGTRAQGRYLQ